MTAEVGSQYRFSFTVADDTGAPVNPATKTVTVTLPDQSTVTPTVSTNGTGSFYSDYTFVQEGLHRFSVATTGPVTHKTDFTNASVFRSIIGVDEARDYVGETTTARNDQLRQALMALTEKIESIVGITVPKRFVDEHVTGYQVYTLRLPHGPLLTSTSVESITAVYPGGPTWYTADIIQYPDSATCELYSMLPFWYGPWKATYTAGRAVIPQPIQLAMKEALFDLWANQDLDPGTTTAERWESAVASYDMPAHARSMLEQYELPGFA